MAATKDRKVVKKITVPNDQVDWSVLEALVEELHKDWWEVSRKVEGKFGPQNLKVASSNFDQFGRATVFRHGCGGLAGLAIEADGDIRFIKIPGSTEEEVTCHGCQTLIPTALLKSHWLQQQLSALNGTSEK